MPSPACAAHDLRTTVRFENHSFGPLLNQRINQETIDGD